MKVELQSNRRLFINLTLLPLIFITIALIIGFLIDIEGALENIFGIVMCIIFDLIFFVILILLIALPKPTCNCDSENIIISRKNIETKINVNEIEYIHFQTLKFKKFFLVLIGGVIDEGLMKIHIKTIDNKKYEFGYVNLKDAKKIKELYPNLMEIL